MTMVLHEVLVDVDVVPRGDRFAQSMPFGHSAQRVASVSCVGVTAAFASHSIGPRPATTSRTIRSTCVTATAPHRTAGAPVESREDAAIGARPRRPPSRAARRADGGRVMTVLQRSVSRK